MQGSSNNDIHTWGEPVDDQSLQQWTAQQQQRYGSAQAKAAAPQEEKPPSYASATHESDALLQKQPYGQHQQQGQWLQRVQQEQGPPPRLSSLRFRQFEALPPNNTQPYTVTAESLRHANRPVAPSLWFDAQNQLMALPCTAVQVHANLHVSTASVRMQVAWVNTTQQPVNGVIAVPTKGTVTGAFVRVGANRYLETMVVDSKDCDNMAQKQAAQSADKSPLSLLGSRAIADVFFLPVDGIQPGEAVFLALDYIEPLVYKQGRYHMNIPLSFPQGAIPGPNAIQISGFLNTVVPNTQMWSLRHQLGITPMPGALHFQAHANTIVDLDLSYALRSPCILGTLLKESHMTPQGHEQGNFVMFLAPPTPDMIKQHFSREVVFLIDRSGSMGGRSWQQAVQGLQAAINQLQPHDFFTIYAFDHQNRPWNPIPQAASDENKAQAMTWINNNPPGGATDIRTPLLKALDVLNRNRKPNSVPICMLITDGMVANERSIVKDAMAAMKDVRIFTMGIGTYCNWLFLKTLAELGRGYNETVVYSANIAMQMHDLMAKAATPVLTDITISMQGVNDAEIYPFPIPDLFMGSPLLVSGKFTAKGLFPMQVLVNGTLSNGQRVVIPVNTQVNQQIPVQKVFLKQKLDLLTSRWWLNPKQKLQDEVVELSCTHGLPSNFTSMVAYETTEDNLNQQDDEEARARDKEEADRKHTAKMRNRERVVALAVGGVLVVSTAALVMGSLADSLGNGSGLDDTIVDQVEHLVENMDCCRGGGGNCNCGDCGLGGVDCGAICDCMGGVIDFLAGCFEGIGGCLDGCFGGIGECACNVVGCIGDCDWGGVGDCLGGALDCTADLMGGCAGGLCDCLGGCCQVLEGLGDCAGDCNCDC